MKSGATTILIVEDSPVQAELLRHALEGAGYKVIAAGNGAEALALARESHPAAVVSDINMPVMDGYAMCAAIRSDETLKTTPVILLTMLSDPLNVIRGLNAGADGYVTKPYNVPTLIARVESLLDYPPAPAPPVERRKVEIRLAGKTHVVDAHGPRMLNLLVSTYENAVLQNRDLVATQQALEDLNQHLEKKVLEKTAELRESEQRFRALIENGSDLVVVIDAHGKITFVSPSVRRVGGYEPAELLGKGIAEFIHPEDAPAALADLSALVSDPDRLHVAELRYRRKEGGWIILETVARSAVNDPAVAGVVVNARDVTERKESEQALRESEEKLRTISSSAQDGIVMADNDGRIEFWNPSAARLFGYTLDEATGQPLHDLIVPERLREKVQPGFEQFRATGQGPIVGKVLELPSLRKDGTEFVAEHSIAAVKLKGKWHAVGLVRDITERKRAEEDRQNHAQRLERALESTVRAVAATVEMKDPYTAGHQRRVADLAVTIARKLGLPEAQIHGLRLAGIVHDLGKIHIPTEILSKPGRLTEIEFNLIKIHPVSGSDILKDVEFPWPIAQIVLQHHERLNGSGYPHGLTDGQILPEARILAVADVVEAMASHRPYRAALGVATALEEIERGRGSSYDPAVSDACLGLFRNGEFAFRT